MTVFQTWMKNWPIVPTNKQLSVIIMIADINLNP